MGSVVLFLEVKKNKFIQASIFIGDREQPKAAEELGLGDLDFGKYFLGSLISSFIQWGPPNILKYFEKSPSQINNGRPLE